MTKRGDGLIVNVSSPGGLKYLFNVCYGVGKTAVDRMAADCAVELKEHNVTMISLWPGPVKTEYIKENVLTKSDGRPFQNISNFYVYISQKSYIYIGLSQTGAFHNAETVEFSGKAVTKLAMDPKRIDKTGRILFVCDLAMEYNFTDEDGDVHDVRSLSYNLGRNGRTWLASVMPGFIRIPCFLMHFASNKF